MNGLTSHRFILEMSGICLLSICLLFYPQTANAKTETKTFVLNFSENDFSWVFNKDGELEFESITNFIYPESDEPGLPLISKDIAIDGRYSYKSSAVTYEKREVLSDVRLAPSPMPVTTEIPTNKNVGEIRRSYDATLQFPSSNCRYVSTSNWENVSVLHFLASPYMYDAPSQKLYFIDSIRLDIEMEARLTIQCKPLDRINASILKSFVINSDVVDELVASSPIDMQSIELEDRIDYVVITNQALASSFKPLCQWKTEKGVYARVITIEDIEANYGGKDIQLKIKKCLYDLYQNHGLKYVLLGGDDYIVPVRGCYGAVKTDKGLIRDNTIPTDMYYACFDGCFDWDENKNGIYGETTDNINLLQSIYVTRLPVSQAIHVDSFINKLFTYEKDPIFNNSILMCGVNTFNSGTESQSDSEMQGNKLYSRFIKPNWNGVRYKFYDTSTDFEENEAYDVSADNLSKQLENGYSFMDIITHGTQTSWATEIGKHYDITFGNQQRNKALTIITTVSCSTNAFDFSVDGGTIDPCLSESLIRNPNSGMIAYLGCSRRGFGYEKDHLGTSISYEADFYKKLFSNAIVGMNFGVLVGAIKTGRISSCGNDGSWRWVQYGLNPIGDPEMPIWISQPIRFNSANISIDGPFVRISSDEEHCRICVVDEWDHGEGYFNVFEDTNYALVSDLPEESSICLTKPGYIPKQYKLNILQNKIISGNRTFSNDVILCGSSITSSMKQGQFVIKDGKTTLKGDIIVLGPGTKVENGAQLVIKNK